MAMKMAVRPASSVITRLSSISGYNGYPRADPLADVFGPAAQSFVEYLQLFLLVPGRLSTDKKNTISEFIALFSANSECCCECLLTFIFVPATKSHL